MRTTILFCLSLLLFACTKNKVQNYVTNETLNGKVKTITDSVFDMKARDRKGTNSPRRLVQRNVYSFDEQGKATAGNNTIYTDGPDGQGIFITSYKFDSSGIVTNNESKSNGQTSFTTYYKHDEGRKITAEYYKLVNLDQVDTIVYVYDGDVLASKKEKGLHGMPPNITTYFYDGEGYVAAEINSMAGQPLSDTTTYKYKDIDKQGNWTKRNQYYRDMEHPYYMTVRTILYYQ